MLFLTTSQNGRICKRFITALLKSRTATDIRRLQYCKHYQLAQDGTSIQQQEQKILMITHDPSKQKKLTILADQILGQGTWEILDDVSS